MRGLNFQEDERLEITSPPDRAEVRLPFVVRWTVSDFRVTGRDGNATPDAGYFGVYIDRAPQPPNRTQAWLVREDQRCRRLADCTASSFLADQNIFAVTETSFTVERVQAPSSQAPKRREFHDVTIVLLNGRGERIGESAFIRQFEVNRDV